MTLLIIRHGESEADLLNIHEGRADYKLTSHGHDQAEAMAAYVKAHYKVSKIYSSTLTRAKQTAQHLSTAVSCPVILEPLLMEFNNGLIAGMNKQDAAKKYPIVPNIPIHASVYKQESMLEFRFRADHILSKIISECTQEDTVVIVSHGGMINQLYRSFLRLPVDSDIFFGTGDTGIHEWNLHADRHMIIKSNQLAHLQNILE